MSARLIETIGRAYLGKSHGTAGIIRTRKRDCAVLGSSSVVASEEWRGERASGSEEEGEDWAADGRLHRPDLESAFPSLSHAPAGPPPAARAQDHSTKTIMASKDDAVRRFVFSNNTRLILVVNVECRQRHPARTGFAS